MLWVWIIESILLGLTGLLVVSERWIVAAQLTTIACTAALQLVCMAWPLDQQHEVSLAHLNAVTGLLLYSASQLDVQSVQDVVLFSWLVVLQTLALGMVFASRAPNTATPLWLHPGSVLLLVLPLWLQMYSWLVTSIMLSVGAVIVAISPPEIQYVFVSLTSACLAILMWTWWSLLPGIVAAFTAAACVREVLQTAPTQEGIPTKAVNQQMKYNMFRMKGM